MPPKAAPAGAASKKEAKAPPVKTASRAMAGVYESRIAEETAHKEQKCRERFEDKSQYYKKSRNPCNGELTPRDDAEFLIPMQKTIKQQMEEQCFNDFEETRARTMQLERDRADPIDKFVRPRDVSGAVAIRQQRSNLDRELEQMKNVAEYKKMQITLKGHSRSLF